MGTSRTSSQPAQPEPPAEVCVPAPVTSIDWYYHRPACAVCRQVRSFLARHRIKVLETVFANQHKLGPEQALERARGAGHVWVIRGSKIVHYDMTVRPPGDSELLKAILAPSGRLRAPTVMHGRDLIVGFHPGAYADLLGYATGSARSG